MTPRGVTIIEEAEKLIMGYPPNPTWNNFLECIRKLIAEVKLLEKQLQDRDGSTWRELNEHRAEAWMETFNLRIQLHTLVEKVREMRKAQESSWAAYMPSGVEFLQMGVDRLCDEILKEEP